jgi:hypothetical protein
MRNANVIDIETFNNRNGDTVPYCLILTYENNLLTFYGLKCIQNALNWIFNFCNNNSFFFTHNLTFDGLIIINNLPKNVEISNFGTSLKNCSIYGLSLICNKKSIFFKCSVKFFPLQLKDIAFLLNVSPKLLFDYDSVKEYNYKDSNIKKKTIEYCKRDVHITQLLLYRLNTIIEKFIPN